MRNQELSNGSIPLKYNFGGILGSNNINIRASEYGEGGRITYSSSNRSYSNRLMATYNSGMLKKGGHILFLLAEDGEMKGIKMLLFMILTLPFFQFRKFLIVNTA